MADTKISALTAASTPLAGTEVLPIVQSSTTKKVAVSDLTAGRSVSAASLSLTTTPLAVTSGGTGTATALTAGSVVFAGASGVYSQDNANLFWDDSNNRLGIGINSSLLSTLHVNGQTRISGVSAGSTALVIVAGDILSDVSSGAFAIGNYGNSSSEMRISTRGFTTFRTGATDGTNGTEAMRVHASRGVSIGNTTDPGAGNLFVNSQIGVGANATAGYIQTSQGGTADSTLYRHHKHNAGGGTAIATSCTQTTTAITTAKTIAGLEDASLVLVRGSDGAGNEFMDLLITMNSGTPTVITSKTLSGSPAARTYTISSFNLQLAMASGTYTTNCLWWQLSAR